jgi:high-affinity iron transporter
MVVNRGERVLFRKSLWVFLVVLIEVSGASAQPVPLPSASPVDTAGAQQLVFLLQYVGSDYESAIENGRIVDDAEYRENREFTALILERFHDLRLAIPPAKVPALEKDLRTLDELVSARADARLVRELTEAAIPLVVEAFGLRSFPHERPNPERASHLYTEGCTPCHGAHGGGDGPRAKELHPPPARFTDPVRMSRMAPYLFYNAITLGIPNTAMASFSDSLSDQERWDLAFYLWTFALPRSEDAPGTGTQLSLSLRDLATRSSVELAPEVMRQAAAQGQSIDVAETLAWLARLRADPPPLSPAQGQLARLRRDLDRSTALIERGEMDAASDLVTGAYLTEFEPLEPELDRRDARVRLSFERGLLDLRAALRRADRPAALATVKTLEEAIVQAERLFEPSKPGKGLKAPIVLVILLVAAALGGVLLVWWIGKETAVS